MLYDMADLKRFLNVAPPVVLDIWDRDGMLESDDFLGRCTIHLKDASTNLDERGRPKEGESNGIPEPKWHDIRIGFDEHVPA